MPASLTPEQAQLLESLEALLAHNQNLITLPMTAINQGIAQLSVQSSKVVNQITSKLVKTIDQYMVANDNAIDSFSLAILKPLQAWQDENLLLLTQLASYSGLTKPGDSLEQALVEEIAHVPELAYSATLLIALREAVPHLAGLVEVLKEIRDRLPGVPLETPGELPATAAAIKVIKAQPTNGQELAAIEGPDGVW